MSDQGPGDHGPACLHAMDPRSTAAGATYWVCTNCGQTRLG